VVGGKKKKVNIFKYPNPDKLPGSIFPANFTFPVLQSPNIFLS